METLLSVEELAIRIHKSVASIRSDATRNPESLPPICRLPGNRRLLWRDSDVSKWIAKHVVSVDEGNVNPTEVENAKPKRGRPTKISQVEAQKRYPKVLLSADIAGAN